MSALAVFNILGVLATVLLAAVVGSLGCAATASGRAHVIPLMPQWNSFGNTPAKIAMGMAGDDHHVAVC